MSEEIKYVLVEHKNHVTVYAGGFIMCIIDKYFAVKRGYSTPIDYCRKVFA